MSGTVGFQLDMAVDKDNNIYTTGDNDGKVYKTDAGTNTFHEMTQTIAGTTTARNVYKCLSGQSTFTITTGLPSDENYRALDIDIQGNVYVGGIDTGGGQNLIYKCLAGQTNFTATSFAGGGVQGLESDANDNLYTAGSSGVYRLLNGGTTFFQLFGTGSTSLNAIVCAPNATVYTIGIGAAYFGD